MNRKALSDEQLAREVGAAVATPQGRAVIGQTILEPFKKGRDYVAIGRQMMFVDHLPTGAPMWLIERSSHPGSVRSLDKYGQMLETLKDSATLCGDNAEYDVKTEIDNQQERLFTASAYVLGVYLGDGTVNIDREGRYRVKLQVTDKDYFILRISKQVVRALGLEFSIERKRKQITESSETICHTPVRRDEDIVRSASKVAETSGNAMSIVIPKDDYVTKMMISTRSSLR